MVKNAYQAKEICVTVANKIGVLADIAKIVSSHGINISAVAGYAVDENNAKIMLVTEDNVRAQDALKKSKYTSIQERPVVIVELENKSGALRQITDKLAAQSIDIKQVYGTACSAGCPAKIVLSTSDNDKALVAFKK